MKKQVPLVLGLLAGVFALIEFYVPWHVVGDIQQRLLGYAQVLAAAAFVLGGINVIQVNWPKIRRREADWQYKVVLLCSAAIMGLAGVEWQSPDKEPAAAVASEQAGGQASAAVPETAPAAPLWGPEGRVYVWLYDYVFYPCNATMFSLLAFFIASAAFRAFRARNTEAALLLGAAIIIMLGRAPIGRAISDVLPVVADWILDVPNNAGRRAIMMGAALGAIATGLRIILGLERSHLGAGE